MPALLNTYDTRVDKESVLTDLTPRSPDPCIDAIASLHLGNLVRASDCFEEDEDDDDDDDDEDCVVGPQAPDFCGLNRPRLRRGSLAADDRFKALASGQSAPRLLGVSTASPRTSTSVLERMVSEPPPTPDNSRSTFPRRPSSPTGRRQIMFPRAATPPRSIQTAKDVKTASLLPVSTHAELTAYPPEAKYTYLDMLKTATDCSRLSGEARQLERSRSRSPSQPTFLHRRALCTTSLCRTQQSRKEGRETVLNCNKVLLAQWPQLHVTSLTDDNVEELGREALNSDLASHLCGDFKLVSAHTI